jgi:hypothetical protein
MHLRGHLARKQECVRNYTHHIYHLSETCARACETAIGKQCKVGATFFRSMPACAYCMCAIPHALIYRGSITGRDPQDSDLQTWVRCGYPARSTLLICGHSYYGVGINDYKSCMRGSTGFRFAIKCSVVHHSCITCCALTSIPISPPSTHLREYMLWMCCIF